MERWTEEVTGEEGGGRREEQLETAVGLTRPEQGVAAMCVGAVCHVTPADAIPEMFCSSVPVRRRDRTPTHDSFVLSSSVCAAPLGSWAGSGPGGGGGGGGRYRLYC